MVENERIIFASLRQLTEKRRQVLGDRVTQSKGKLKDFAKREKSLSRNADILEVVNNALSQWCLRPNDHQLNASFLRCSSQRLNISGVNIQVMGDLSRTGITRSDIAFFNLGTLG